MSKLIIFRDDDVSFKTDLRHFEQVHQLFKKHIILHTVALICEGIEKNPELIEFINSNNIDVQVHCWKHYDLTTDLKQTEKDLVKCIEAINKHFKHAPNVLYPPWNKTSPALEAIANKHGLFVSAKKASLSQYIRFGGDIGERVVNFHSWNLEECNQLEHALKLYSNLR